MNKKVYFCLAVRRHYEENWRIIDKFDTLDQAQVALDERRSYEGVFNYDNAELRIFSREEGKLEFGPRWEYRPIGTQPTPAPAKKPAAKPRRPAAKAEAAKTE